jgi:hypothetical protein
MHPLFTSLFLHPNLHSPTNARPSTRLSSESIFSLCRSTRYSQQMQQRYILFRSTHRLHLHAYIPIFIHSRSIDQKQLYERKRSCALSQSPHQIQLCGRKRICTFLQSFHHLHPQKIIPVCVFFASIDRKQFYEFKKIYTLFQRSDVHPSLLYLPADLYLAATMQGHRKLIEIDKCKALDLTREE